MLRRYYKNVTFLTYLLQRERRIGRIFLENRTWKNRAMFIEKQLEIEKSKF